MKESDDDERLPSVITSENEEEIQLQPETEPNNDDKDQENEPRVSREIGGLEDYNKPGLLETKRDSFCMVASIHSKMHSGTPTRTNETNGQKRYDLSFTK